MRILHVLGKLDRGGVETWLLQVLRHIDREKYQMDFLVHTTEKGAYDDEVRALGAQIIPCLRPSRPALYAKNFCGIIREYGPYDVVHSHVHHYSGYVLTLAALCGVPVRIAHSHSDTRLAESNAGAARRFYRSAMRALIRRFGTRGLAVSTGAGKDLFPFRFGDSQWWMVHPLGIDLSPYEFAPDQSARDALGIPKGALVIGHVGRFTAEKNHDFIVEIARELISREPRAFFLLVGDGPLRSSVEAAVKEYGMSEHFLFTGLRADVPFLMKNAMDIFLFPSTREGLPVALLEAQAAGLASVISDAVSQEVDVVTALIERLSCRRPASDWASVILNRAQAGRLPWRDLAEHLAERSIESSVASLTPAYRLT